MKGIVALIGAVILGVSPTLAVTDSYGVIVPPVKWMLKYTSPVWNCGKNDDEGRVVCRTEKDIGKICETLVGDGSTYQPYGCSINVGRVCIIFVNVILPDDELHRVIWHEMAHCAGWPASHPMDE